MIYFHIIKDTPQKEYINNGKISWYLKIRKANNMPYSYFRRAVHFFGVLLVEPPLFLRAVGVFWLQEDIYETLKKETNLQPVFRLVVRYAYGIEPPMSI